MIQIDPAYCTITYIAKCNAGILIIVLLSIPVSYLQKWKGGDLFVQYFAIFVYSVGDPDPTFFSLSDLDQKRITNFLNLIFAVPYSNVPPYTLCRLIIPLKAARGHDKK